MGRGVSSAHKKLDAEKEHLLPTIAHDFGFMGKADEKATAIMVSKSSRSLWIDAAAVPCKGASDEYSVEQCASAILRMGHSRFITKSDQEHSIEEVVRKAA